MSAGQLQSIASNADPADWRNAIQSGAEDRLAMLTLDDHGMVCDCTGASESLFGYSRDELVCHPISMLLPQLAEWDLMENGQPNPSLRFLCRIGRHFQAMTRDGEYFASELFLNLLNGVERGGLSLIVRPAEDHREP